MCLSHKYLKNIFPMLHSRSIQDQKMDSFVRMLKFAVSGKEIYTPIIKEVLYDAHLLSLGNKNYYNIDRDDYHVIIYLVKKDKPFFEKLNIETLKNEDYEHVLSTIFNDQQVSYA